MKSRRKKLVRKCQKPRKNYQTKGGRYWRLNSTVCSGDAIANDVFYHNLCWATVKKKAEAPQKTVYTNKEIIRSLSETKLINLIESELNDPSHQILDINSVANKEIKLGWTFLSAERNNRARGGDAPSSGGVRERSPFLKKFRLCVALDWLKIGLNDNIFCLFPEYMVCC